MLKRHLPAVILCCLLAGCGSRGADGIASKVIPAPDDAVAFTLLNSGQLAILGGSQSAKTVTIERIADGSVVKQFGVTLEAGSIATGPGDTVYLGLATAGGGAVEQWDTAGRHLRTLPMPGGVRQVGTSSGATWALSSVGDARVAVSVPPSGEQPGKNVPLPAGTTYVRPCDGVASSLIVTESGEKITLVRTSDGATTDTGDAGATPVCSNKHSAIFALMHQGSGVFVNTIAVPSLLKAGQFPTMREAVSLESSPDGALIVLGRGSGAAAFRVYAASTPELRVKG